MNSLDLLIKNNPTWVTMQESSQERVKILVSPPSMGTATQRDFYLELRSSNQRGVRVFEQKNHKQFPDCCIERHINYDSSFCVYRGSEENLEDQDRAIAWWSNLAVYLNNQIYAEKYGLWPLASGLSHGDAANEQLAMEELVENLGWKDELLKAIFRSSGWLAEPLPRISKTHDQMLNARAPCPRGCTRKHKILRNQSCERKQCSSGCTKQHKPILRKDCPNREVIEQLVFHEYRRRKAEAELVDGLLQKGIQCCGSMKNCQLRDR
ncbi:E2 domain-containing protein [Emcibacter nanhaiensis]|uniref:Uncharacterized protein n=1 Tax=Emcibacter nanhaiensis TaxID=1505037 RepID=A0A501PH16_9PROT|nr:E2 domain-containing protein [Emcibacter nanhaiensis]TPD59332.1 hypothetical protein FIV46_11085 [Emcibacter nanhaiensis]